MWASPLAESAQLQGALPPIRQAGAPQARQLEPGRWAAARSSLERQVLVWPRR